MMMNNALTLNVAIRPTNLDEFIGNREAVDMACAYVDGRAPVPASIFVGQPGTGKTTLAHILADKYDLEAVEVNASAIGSKKALKELVRSLQSENLDGKRKLLILDEADREEVQDKLSDLVYMDHLVILLANHQDHIHYRLLKDCQRIIFQKPTHEDFSLLLSRFGLEAPPEIMNQFMGFRDVINWVQGGDARGEPILTEIEIARSMFMGGYPIIKRNWPNLKIFLLYFLYNGGNPSLVRELTLMAREGGLWLAWDLLMEQRVNKIINKPYRWNKWKKSEGSFKSCRLRIVRWF